MFSHIVYLYCKVCHWQPAVCHMAQLKSNMMTSLRKCWSLNRKCCSGSLIMLHNETMDLLKQECCLAHQYDCINVFEIWYFHVFPKRKKKCPKQTLDHMRYKLLMGTCRAGSTCVCVCTRGMFGSYMFTLCYWIKSGVGRMGVLLEAFK